MFLYAVLWFLVGVFFWGGGRFGGGGSRCVLVYFVFRVSKITMYYKILPKRFFLIVTRLYTKPGTNFFSGFSLSEL